MKNKNAGDADVLIFLMLIFVLNIVELILMTDDDKGKMGARWQWLLG